MNLLPVSMISTGLIDVIILWEDEVDERVCKPFFHFLIFFYIKIGSFFLLNQYILNIDVILFLQSIEYSSFSHLPHKYIKFTYSAMYLQLPTSSSTS
jgi:hypothetical protein